MKYETFKAMLDAQQKQHEVDRKIMDVLRLAQSDTYYMGTTIDEIGRAFDMVFKDEYNNSDLIDWWLYEDVDKHIFNADSEEIIADLTEMKDLWLYLEASKNEEERENNI